MANIKWYQVRIDQPVDHFDFTRFARAYDLTGPFPIGVSMRGITHSCPVGFGCYNWEVWPLDYAFEWPEGTDPDHAEEWAEQDHNLSDELVVEEYSRKGHDNPVQTFEKCYDMGEFESDDRDAGGMTGYYRARDYALLNHLI